jgi:FkbM family methyltransferase
MAPAKAPYPFRMRLVAALSKTFPDFDYTVRHGLLRGMRRHGGLGWVPSRARLTAEEEWLTRQNFTGKVVYDVGAFHGLLTLHFARAARHVFAFEPVARHRAIIERNVRLNRFQDRVTLVPYAAGDHASTEKILIDPLLPGTATASPRIQRHVRGGEYFAIEVRPVDDLSLPAPDFIKIDVEGMELDALRGMQRTLREHGPELYIEIHGATPEDARDNLAQISALLRGFGYRIDPLPDGHLHGTRAG